MKLRKFLQKNKIEYQDFNVLRDIKARKEMIKISTQTAVPVLEITKSDGTEIIAEFDENKLKTIMSLEV